jgi:hypothetical protein
MTELKPYTIEECKPPSKKAREVYEARDYADRIHPAFVLTPPTPKAPAKKLSKNLFKEES